MRPAATARARRTYHSFVRSGRSARSSSSAVLTVAVAPAGEPLAHLQHRVPTALGLALPAVRRAVRRRARGRARAPGSACGWPR